jgi:aryl-alcohol dehydrogenase-like predicted oxidoreductase
MKYHHLGNSGPKISEAGLGENKFGEPEKLN